MGELEKKLKEEIASLEQIIHTYEEELEAKNELISLMKNEIASQEKHIRELRGLLDMILKK